MRSLPSEDPLWSRFARGGSNIAILGCYWAGTQGPPHEQISLMHGRWITGWEAFRRICCGSRSNYLSICPPTAGGRGVKGYRHLHRAAAVYHNQTKDVWRRGDPSSARVNAMHRAGGNACSPERNYFPLVVPDIFPPWPREVFPSEPPETVLIVCVARIPGPYPWTRRQSRIWYTPRVPEQERGRQKVRMTLLIAGWPMAKGNNNAPHLYWLNGCHQGINMSRVLSGMHAC